MPPRKSTPKSKKLYRVQIDYKAAGVDNLYGPKGLVIYERKSGVMQKIKPALEMGVHPRFITVEEVEADWTPSLEHDGICPACWLPYAAPNEDCPQIARVDKLNAVRERRNSSLVGRGYTPDPLLERPHPTLVRIQERP